MVAAGALYKIVSRAGGVTRRRVSAFHGVEMSDSYGMWTALSRRRKVRVRS